jgi:uncharacterized protein YukE
MIPQQALIEDDDSPVAPPPAPEPFSVQEPEKFAKVYEEATNTNFQKDFVQRVLEARQQPAQAPSLPMQVAPRVLEQTRLEMAAGREQVERVAAERASRQAPLPDKWDGKNTEVFRPGEFTEYKGSFKSQGQTPDKATSGVLPQQG